MSLQLLIGRKKRQGLFLILSLTTLFDIGLLLFRNIGLNPNWQGIHSLEDLHCYDQCNFFFLIWNLFLAWIPYWISISFTRIDRVFSSRVPIILAFIGWLLFFPNAPYIITDFLHLKPRPPIPLWYDLTMLFAFAWTGLMLGFLSLLEVQHFLQKRYSVTFAWVITISSLLLCGFGIFVGRFQRWNSWDIIANPLPLMNDMMTVLLNPIGHAHTLGLAAVIFAILTLGYLTLIILINENRST